MKHINFIKPVFILTLLFVVACSKTPQEQLLGKWQSVSGGPTMEFSDNGNLTLSGQGETLTGNWTIPEEGTLLFANTNGNNPRVSTYVLSGEDSLVITGSDKTQLELTRIKSSSE